VFEQGWDAALALLDQFRALLVEYPLLRSLVSGTRTLAIMFAIIFVLEWATGGRLRRYLTRNFATDIGYGVFYYGGIYNKMIYAPVAAGLALAVPDWNFELLSYLPGPVAFAVYWLSTDAIWYWIHRWYHRNPILWRFHKVHHAQTEMTFVTSFRNHVIEQLLTNVIMFVPLMIFGLPLWYWGPAFFLQAIFEGLQHSDIKWRYGRLYPIFVSPVFHAIHHSPARGRHDSNYGKILSVWDHLFGTMSEGERPAHYGLAGVTMPVSFLGTLAAPFIELWQAGWPEIAKRDNPPESTDPQAEPV
jgi:sterol desaturase/sphingolipid hydroxylase (fatty acid hydroxylase superfamily)